MINILNTPRRLLFNRQWWHAHRMELPDWPTVCLILGAIGMAFMAVYILHAMVSVSEAKAEVAFVRESVGLFKGCVEGRNSLGVAVKEDGKLWREVCKTQWERVS